MVSERQELQARVAEFSQTLPDADGGRRVVRTAQLPRAASVADSSVAMWNRCADRRFARKFSMRGRARGNPRQNFDCSQYSVDLLEGMNLRRCSDFTEEERLDHCAYYVDVYGARVRARSVFGARAGCSLYLSRKERNRMQHALVGNTGASDIARYGKGAAATDEICLFDIGDRRKM